MCTSGERPHHQAALIKRHSSSVTHQASLIKRHSSKRHSSSVTHQASLFEFLISSMFFHHAQMTYVYHSKASFAFDILSFPQLLTLAGNVSIVSLSYHALHDEEISTASRTDAMHLSFKTYLCLLILSYHA
jgi:hypothetical protein